MPLDFSIIIHVRHQFGQEDLDVGVFAAAEASFPFDARILRATAATRTGFPRPKAGTAA